MSAPIPVVHLPPGDQWDQNLLDLLLLDLLYPHRLPIEFCAAWPDTAGIILVIPGRYWHDRTDELTAAIARYDWVLAIRTSDEEALLDIGTITHPNLRWWVQTPRSHRDYPATRFLPLGYPPHFNNLPTAAAPKTLDVFLSAQNTHDRRRQAFDALTRVSRSKRVCSTSGFTQGILPGDYAEYMTSARIAPCPSGAVSPETFRVYEALAAHTVPIADDISPVYDSSGYWTHLFPDAPWPTISRYSDLPGYIEDVLADYPRIANRVSAWWIAQKRRMGDWLRNDLAALGVPAITSAPTESPITVLISTSPISSHPSTSIIEDTVASVRAQLPDSEIILMIDGIHPDHEHRRADYETYIQRVLWLADHDWGNTLPLISDRHRHQAGCTRRALEHVRTPLILFAEHDTPLTGAPIPWAGITNAILTGDANLVRLHHEAAILPEHGYLMLDTTPQTVRGVPMSRTIQWSQRPHVAAAAWYRNLLDRWFADDEPDYIEDRIYGRLIDAYRRDGAMGWLGWRTFIYTPPGNIQRSYHTDGRAGEAKL